MNHPVPVMSRRFSARYTQTKYTARSAASGGFFQVFLNSVWVPERCPIARLNSSKFQKQTFSSRLARAVGVQALVAGDCKNEVRERLKEHQCVNRWTKVFSMTILFTIRSHSAEKAVLGPVPG